LMHHAQKSTTDFTDYTEISVKIREIRVIRG
jgi:hypothetical protein